MKDDLDYFVVESYQQEKDDETRFFLHALQWPEVVFPVEIFTAGEMRQPAILHAQMERFGYSAVAPASGERWRWRLEGTEFSARWAYIKTTTLALALGRSAAVGAKIRARAVARLSPTDPRGTPTDPDGLFGVSREIPLSGDGLARVNP